MASRFDPLRSGAFRFALAFAGIFAIAAMLMLTMVRHQVGRYSHEAMVGSLTTESAVLALEDRAHLVAAIRQRMRAAPGGPFFYLLRDVSGRRLAGSLDDAVVPVGWGHIVMREERPSARNPAPPEEELLTFGRRLPDGALLIVATDGFDIARVHGSMVRFTLLWGMAITLLALLAGWWTARLFLARLDAVNVSVGRVMAGRMDERLPDIGLAPELDALSRNLNRMLDRIGGLMDGLRQVSTDVAHDLRTPLTRLRHRLEAARNATGRGEAEAGIDAAIAQTDQILATFRAILRLAQIEGGSRRAGFAPVDVGALVQGLYETYEPVAADAGHRLFVASSTPLVVAGDEELLAQLLANLIENAIVHTPQGTTIRLLVARERQRITVTVADDGPGVPNAERSRLCDRFYQVDPSRSGGNAGLGLAISNAIANLHGATLVIRDNTPGLHVTVDLAADVDRPLSHDDPARLSDAGFQTL